MRVASLSLANFVLGGGLLFPSSVQAFLSLHKKEDAPSVVGLSLERRHVVDPVQSDRRHLSRKRQLSPNGTISAGLDWEENLYFCNVTIGTPPQSLRLALDTGSTLVWVNTPASGFCSAPDQPCSSFGVYDSAASTSYRPFNSSDPFDISYTQGWEVSGPFARDVLNLDGVTLDNATFAVANHSNVAYGVLGVAPRQSDTRSGKVSFPHMLAEQGKIKSEVFSMWVDDLDTNRGSILFGGIDTAKYTGPLQAMNYSGWYMDSKDFRIYATKLSVQTGDDQFDVFDYEKDDIHFGATLDSGTSLSYFPDQVVTPLYAHLNITMNNETGNAEVPCSMRDDDRRITYSFDDATIDAAMRDLILDSPSNSSSSYCIFGILGLDDTKDYAKMILGDTFLRSAYIVYDVTNGVLAMANRNAESTAQESVIVEIDSKGIAAYVDVVQAIYPTSTTSTTSTTAAAAATSTSSAHAVLATSNPRHLVAGLAAGAGAGFLLVL